jgi:hypothetical protein
LEGPSSETLLKSLWKHANNYYFKKIEEAEYERINYVESVLNSPSEGTVIIYARTTSIYSRIGVLDVDSSNIFVKAFAEISIGGEIEIRLP